MKNRFYKFILLAAMVFGMSGCGLFSKLHKDDTNTVTVFGTPAMYGQAMVINARQLDSICTVDGLSPDLDDWMAMSYYDYETGEKIDRYAYIKALNDEYELSYILTPQDTLFTIMKRIVKEETE